MKAIFRVAMLLWGLGGGARVDAETWTTQTGETFEARLSGVYGPLAVFAERERSRQLAIEALDDAGVERVADFVDARAPRKRWSQSESVLARALRGRLVTVRNGKVGSFEPGDAPEPEIYLLFFGAGWSEGTKRFLPGLIERYVALKQARGNLFELVYFGRDREPSDHADFIKGSQMPWPAVRFSALGELKVLERWDAGSPSIVAVTPDSEVILHHERAGGAPVNPAELLAEFAVLVTMMDGESDLGKRARHRLAVVQHRRAASAGEQPPRPYVIGLDRSRYTTLEEKRLVLTLQLDERGSVAGVDLDPDPGAVLRAQFEQDARRWLFLPALRDGKPRQFTVKLPIEF